LIRSGILSQAGAESDVVIYWNLNLNLNLGIMGVEAAALETRIFDVSIQKRFKSVDSLRIYNLRR
jgi:hypothetical protein